MRSRCGYHSDSHGGECGSLADLSLFLQYLRRPCNTSSEQLKVVASAPVRAAVPFGPVPASAERGALRPWLQMKTLKALCRSS